MKENRIIVRLGRMLAYINRAKQYISTVNSLILVILLLKSFDVKLKLYMYPGLILLTIFIFLVIGFIDTKLGIRRMESLDNELNRPVLMEMKDNIRIIMEHIKLEKKEK